MTRLLYTLLRWLESLRPEEYVPLTKERKRFIYQTEGRREQ